MSPRNFRKNGLIADQHAQTDAFAPSVPHNRKRTFLSGRKAAHPLKQRLKQRQIEKGRNVFAERHQMALVITPGGHSKGIEQKGPIAQG